MSGREELSEAYRVNRWLNKKWFLFLKPFGKKEKYSA
jgi:hypothetical protein